MSGQVPIGSEETVLANSSTAQSSDVARSMSVKSLAPNEFLFQVGDPRACLYRVESGLLAIYEPHLSGNHAVIDFAFPGDLVGVGFLQHQTYTARAMVETQVDCLPINSADLLVAGNPKAEAKLAQAIEREIELRKAHLVEAGRHHPIERVAALLVTLSQMNRQEGGDPDIVADCVQVGAISDQLQLSADEFTELLLELEKLGLIETCSIQGLRITDHGGLEELAGRIGTPGLADSGALDLASPISRVA